MLYFLRLCFLESCLWFPVRYGSLLSLWERFFSVTPPSMWCLRSLRWKGGKGGATTFSITVLKVSPCKHWLTTAKVLEQILLPRQARRPELLPKDWMLPAFCMSVNSNIGVTFSSVSPEYNKHCFTPPSYSLDLLKKNPCRHFYLYNQLMG